MTTKTLILDILYRSDCVSKSEIHTQPLQDLVISATELQNLPYRCLLESQIADIGIFVNLYLPTILLLKQPIESKSLVGTNLRINIIDESDKIY